MAVTTDPSSHLCTSCGLCCNGTLYSIAKAEPDEETRLLAEGFRLWDGHGTRGFSLGCHKLDGRTCGWYEARPTICRTFRCYLLQDLESGAVSSEETHRRLGQTLTEVEKLTALLSEGDTLVALFDRRAAGQPVEPRLNFQAGVVILLLNRYFRKGEGRAISAAP